MFYHLQLANLFVTVTNPICPLLKHDFTDSNPSYMTCTERLGPAFSIAAKPRQTVPVSADPATPVSWLLYCDRGGGRDTPFYASQVRQKLPQSWQSGLYDCSRLNQRHPCKQPETWGLLLTPLKNAPYCNNSPRSVVARETHSSLKVTEPRSRPRPAQRCFSNRCINLVHCTCTHRNIKTDVAFFSF